MDYSDVTEMLHVMGFVWDDGIAQTLNGWAVGEPVARYQRAFAGEAQFQWLRVDGVAGPITQAALERWGTRLSEHFEAEEFTDRRVGRNGIQRSLVHGMELLRRRTGRAINIRSGYRTPQTNHVVGGAKGSQHLNGLAADFSPPLPHRLVRGLVYFTGMGLIAKGSMVRHVDLRSPGNPHSPATWRY